MAQRNRRVLTKNGHDLFVMASLLQKSLRRGDVVLASKACVELLPQFSNYCWNRLLIVSAEDTNDMVTGEIVALWQAFEKIKKNTNYGDPTTIFHLKAIVLLAKARHSRDTDELFHLVVAKIPDEVLLEALEQARGVFEDPSPADFEIPEWVYDKHTRQGKQRGATLEDFLRDEHDALSDRTSIFANFDEMLNTWGYAEPQVEFGEGPATG